MCLSCAGLCRSEEGILHWPWRNKSVNELVDSILANGYWEHEELFATEEGDRLVVVEGNRRLSAVKILSEPDLREQLGIQLTRRPSKEVLESIRELPVIHTTRKELWGFVGFKHVNGPQAWDSIAKAEYVFRVRRNFGLSLAEIASGTCWRSYFWRSPSCPHGGSVIYLQVYTPSRVQTDPARTHENRSDHQPERRFREKLPWPFIWPLHRAKNATRP